MNSIKKGEMIGELGRKFLQYVSVIEIHGDHQIRKERESLMNK